jgi:hypothetical protein
MGMLSHGSILRKRASRGPTGSGSRRARGYGDVHSAVCDTVRDVPIPLEIVDHRLRELFVPVEVCAFTFRRPRGISSLGRHHLYSP